MRSLFSSVVFFFFCKPAYFLASQRIVTQLSSDLNDGISERFDNFTIVSDIQVIDTATNVVVTNHAIRVDANINDERTIVLPNYCSGKTMLLVSGHIYIGGSCGIVMLVSFGDREIRIIPLAGHFLTQPDITTFTAISNRSFKVKTANSGIRATILIIGSTS